MSSRRPPPAVLEAVRSSPALLRPCRPGLAGGRSLAAAAGCGPAGGPLVSGRGPGRPQGRPRLCGNGSRKTSGHRSAQLRVWHVPGPSRQCVSERLCVFAALQTQGDRPPPSIRLQKKRLFGRIYLCHGIWFCLLFLS